MKEALKLALEFLEDNQHYVADNERHVYVMLYNEVIEKCKAALAKQDGQSNFCAQCEAFARELKAVKQAALAQPAQEPKDIAELVEGMEVSIDVSTGDHDSGHRLFGIVTLVQENQGSKHGLILLVQDIEANFEIALAQPAQEPVVWGYRICEFCGCHTNAKARACCDAGRDADKALAQPAQEPVSVTYKEVADAMNSLWNGTLEQHQIAEQMANKKLYTTPQQRPWVGLTEEDREKFDEDQLGWNDLLTAADALLKEKNNG